MTMQAATRPARLGLDRGGIEVLGRQEREAGTNTLHSGTNHAFLVIRRIVGTTTSHSMQDEITLCRLNRAILQRNRIV